MDKHNSVRNQLPSYENDPRLKMILSSTPDSKLMQISAKFHVHFLIMFSFYNDYLQLLLSILVSA